MDAHDLAVSEHHPAIRVERHQPRQASLESAHLLADSLGGVHRSDGSYHATPGRPTAQNSESWPVGLAGRRNVVGASASVYIAPSRLRWPRPRRETVASNMVWIISA